MLTERELNEKTEGFRAASPGVRRTSSMSTGQS